MPINIAINGFGRIGRNILRALYERHLETEISIVAINDMADKASLAHLLQYDSIHGKFMGAVHVVDEGIEINGSLIRVYSEKDPSLLPWGQLEVDVVHECTGIFTHKDDAQKHLQAGAQKVIISAPGKEVDATIVYGVNHHVLKQSDRVISNASCTTNCLAPLVSPLHDSIGIEQGLMTTIHAYTNDQSVTDGPHGDLRRARAAALSMIPTKTGAAAAIGLVIPDLAGKLDGLAVRVPTANVSMVDLTLMMKRVTTLEEVNEVLTQASVSADLAGVLEINDKPLVSIDFNHHPASSVYDVDQTRVQGTLVKVLSWYDNEWGFCNRMLDTTKALMSCA